MKWEIALIIKTEYLYDSILKLRAFVVQSFFLVLILVINTFCKKRRENYFQLVDKYKLGHFIELNSLKRYFLITKTIYSPTHL